MELLSPNHHSHWIYHTMMNDTSGALDLRVRRNVVGYLDIQPVTYKALSASYTTVGGAYIHSAPAQRQHGESSSTDDYTERVLDHYTDQQLCPDQWCASPADTNMECVSRSVQEVPESAVDSTTRVSPPMGTPGPTMTRHSSHIVESPIMISPILATTRSSPVMTHTGPTIIRPNPNAARPSPAMTSHRPAVTRPMKAMARSGPTTERPVTNQSLLSEIESTSDCGQSISGQEMVAPRLQCLPHSRISRPFGFWKDVSDETKGHFIEVPGDAEMTAAQVQWAEREGGQPERKTIISRSTSQTLYTTGYTRPTREEGFRQQERTGSMVSLDRQDGFREEYVNPTGCRCRDMYRRGKTAHDGNLHGRCSMCKVRNTSSIYMGPSEDTSPPFVSPDSRNHSSASDMIRVMSESLSCVNRCHGDPNIANSYPGGQHVHSKEDQGHTLKDNHYWAVRSTELSERRKPQPPPPATMPCTHNYNTNTASFSPVLTLPSLKSEHSPENSLRSSHSSCRNIVRMVAQSLLEDSENTTPSHPTSTYPPCSPNTSPTMSTSSNDSLSPNVFKHDVGPIPAVFEPASSPSNLSYCPEGEQMDCSNSYSSWSSSEQLSPTTKPEELLPIPRHVLESSSDSEFIDMEEDGRGPGRPIRPVDRMPMRHWLLEQLDRNDVPGLEWLVKQELVFRVPWKHGSRHGWTMEHDACLFVRWAKYTGRLSRHSRPDARRMKANFRSALNSLPDVEQVKGMSRMRGQDAFRVYRFLQPKKRVTK